MLYMDQLPHPRYPKPHAALTHGSRDRVIAFGRAPLISLISEWLAIRCVCVRFEVHFQVKLKWNAKRVSTAPQPLSPTAPLQNGK